MTRNQAFIFNKFHSKFELDRLEYNFFGGLVYGRNEASKLRKQLVVSIFVMFQVFITNILKDPIHNNIMPWKNKNEPLKDWELGNFKIIASVLHHMQVDYFIENELKPDIRA